MTRDLRAASIVKNRGRPQVSDTAAPKRSGIVIFTSLNARVVLPNGVEYESADKVSIHEVTDPKRRGEEWIWMRLNALDKNNRVGDEKFKQRVMRGGLPSYLLDGKKHEPLILRLNRLPPEKRKPATQ